MIRILVMLLLLSSTIFANGPLIEIENEKAKMEVYDDASYLWLKMYKIEMIYRGNTQKDKNKYNENSSIRIYKRDYRVITDNPFFIELERIDTYNEDNKEEKQ